MRISDPALELRAAQLCRVRARRAIAARWRRATDAARNGFDGPFGVGRVAQSEILAEAYALTDLAIRLVATRPVNPMGVALARSWLATVTVHSVNGTTAAEQRSRDATVSDSTPKCGRWGFLAVTDADLALATTASPKWVGPQLGELVTRVPRGTVAHADLGGGWRHPTYYMFGSGPLRITFTDATMWTFEVNRFARGGARRLVRALHDR
jgi:hypothetical protein